MVRIKELGIVLLMWASALPKRAAKMHWLDSSAQLHGMPQVQLVVGLASVGFVLQGAS